MNTGEAGSMGGKSRSRRKIAAARRNGRLGGYPKGRSRRNTKQRKET
jgi:hypothetical protein